MYELEYILKIEIETFLINLLEFIIIIHLKIQKYEAKCHKRKCNGRNKENLAKKRRTKKENGRVKSS